MDRIFLRCNLFFLLTPARLLARRTLTWSLHFFLYSFFLNTSLFAQDGTWTTKANMPTPRWGLGTSVVNGKIYAIGGATSSNGCDYPASSKVEEYDPQTDTWDTTKTAMPLPRESFAISEVNGKIYVIGGSPVTCANHTSTVQEYDPQTDKWSTKTDMPTPRSGLSASVVNGKIYAIGGYTYDPYLPVGNVEEYDPITDKWTKKEPMLSAGGWFSTCVFEGKIYAFGRWEYALQTVDVYDPVTDTWTPKNDMDGPLLGYSASTVGDKIYIFGGVSDFILNGPSPVSDVKEYNPANDTWKFVSPMPTARTAGHASVTGDTVYLFGGSTTNHHLLPVNTVEAYVPKSDTLVGSAEDIFAGKHIPTELVLHQNFPNPFNPSTTIEFSIPKSGIVTLKIYNLLGQEVITLVSDKLTAGDYNYSWNAGDLASGVYVYELNAGGFIEARKMILLR